MSHFSFNSSNEISLDRIYATRIYIFVSLNNCTPEFLLPLTKIRRLHISFYQKTRCIFILKCSRTSPKIHSEQRTNFIEFRLHYFCTVLYQYSDMAPSLSGQKWIFLIFLCLSIPKRDLHTKKTPLNIEVCPEEELKLAFALPHKVAYVPYVKALQKILNLILYTNKKLFKTGYSEQEKCTFCDSESEILDHLFFIALSQIDKHFFTLTKI